MDFLHKHIQNIVGAKGVLADEPMSAHTTFRVGGPADYFVRPTSVEQLAAVIKLCRANDVEVFVMGRGSNLLVADKGLRGCVVQLASNFASAEVKEDGTVIAQAGITNAKLAAIACRKGLAGYEFAAGIPGTIGGAAIMNAGAYGSEFKQVAQCTDCLTPKLRVVTIDAEKANWSYRHSMMGDAGYIVLSATLRLQADDVQSIQNRMDELAQKRADKQPLDMPSAGSTFKRPTGHFAGKLIQDAGMQGYRVGGAQVSTKHAGFVVNVGSATAADVRAVIDAVRDQVASRFGVELEPEVRMWGF